MSIIAEISDAIDNYYTRTGNPPDFVLLSPTKWTEFKAFKTAAIYPALPTNYTVRGVPVDFDKYAEGIQPGRHSKNPGPSTGWGATCVCGSKNPKGAGHSAWCDIWEVK